MAKSPDEIIRDDIRALSAYHVPASAGMVKLDAMENPYGLPADLQAAIAARVGAAAMNRYPNPSAGALKQRLRVVMKVPAGMEIMLGNGSDELIQLLALAVAKPGAVMLGVEPSFVMFRMIAGFAGLRFAGVPLTKEFALDEAALLAAMRAHQPALIFIAYPNNPSGNLFDADVIARVIAAAPGIVVVDEAYHAFAGASFMPRLGEFPTLLVMRTLSKLGLAGLRLGLLAGRAEWLQQIDKLRLPYNINVLTQCVAAEVLQHEGVLDAQAAAIRGERARMLAALQKVPRVTAYPSNANFILFRVAAAGRVFDGLRQRGILIKNLHGGHPLLADCLRVTVGTPDENTKFLQALSALC